MIFFLLCKLYHDVSNLVIKFNNFFVFIPFNEINNNYLVVLIQLFNKYKSMWNNAIVFM